VIKVRITEIYVERLKSYGDYSNRTVGLKAVLDENDDVDEAYRELAGKCETLLKLQEIEADKKLVEWQLKLSEKIIEKIRSIRRALDFYDP